MFFIRLFLVNTWEKKSGVTVLVSSQTAVKGGNGFEIAVRMDNLCGGDWGPIINGPGKPSPFILKIEVSKVLHLA